MPSRQVQVDVRLSGSKLVFSLDPWLAELSRGDTIEWQLAAAADTNELQINARGSNAWPFRDPPPKAAKDKPAKSGAMLPNVHLDKPYRYDVEFTCGGHRVVVDPEMIIRGP